MLELPLMSTEYCDTDNTLEMHKISNLARDWLNNPEVTPEPMGSRIMRYLQLDNRNRGTANEEKLADTEQFDRMLGSISMHDVAVIPEGRKRPRSLDQFEFVPIRHVNGISRPSLCAAYEAARAPEGIRTTYYGEENYNPYLDTQIAIGLTRNKWLVALAAAGIDSFGSLKIVQIQDVSGSTELQKADPKIKFKTGLRDGFLWRDTLVTAWGAMAISLGIGSHLKIQSSENNFWTASGRSFPSYNEVAARMGFERQPIRGNWQKILPRKP
jgi:hypothetical protein